MFFAVTALRLLSPRWVRSVEARVTLAGKRLLNRGLDRKHKSASFGASSVVAEMLQLHATQFLEQTQPGRMKSCLSVFSSLPFPGRHRGAWHRFVARVPKEFRISWYPWVPRRQQSRTLWRTARECRGLGEALVRVSRQWSLRSLPGLSRTVGFRSS